VRALSVIGETVRVLHRSRSFRDSAGNAFGSVAEYIAQPVSMLLAAPLLVHKLGLQQYGVWMIVSAILGSVGILSTGFGDATVKYLSTYRGQKNPAGVQRTIQATLSINLTLGAVFGALVWLNAPFIVEQVFKVNPALRHASIEAIRISAVVLLLRSIESVFVSVLRAFERYGPAVKLNVFLRCIVVVSAVVIAETGHGVEAIMASTLLWSALVVVLQALAARNVVGTLNPFPTFSRPAIAEVFSFGCFSWFQALAGVAFIYADRFLVAAMLGTVPVAIYVLCIQVAQPIHGLASAAFNFLFPHLSSRYGAGETGGPRRVYRLALLANSSVAVMLGLPLIVLGKPVLALWMGNAFATQGYIALALLAVANVILAVNVVPHYTLLAMGKVRFVSLVNVSGGLSSLTMAALLVPSFGLLGAAAARLLYGPVISLNLLQVAKLFANETVSPNYRVAES